MERSARDVFDLKIPDVDLVAFITDAEKLWCACWQITLIAPSKLASVDKGSVPNATYHRCNYSRNVDNGGLYFPVLAVRLNIEYAIDFEAAGLTGR